MSIDHVTVDRQGCELALSLSRSPKLESFFGYKLWGLGVGRRKHAHIFVLPSCETLSFYRSDDLDHLILYAPRLKELNLQAAYSIESVRIIDTLDVIPFCLGARQWNTGPVDEYTSRDSPDWIDPRPNKVRIRTIAEAIAADKPPSRYEVNVANTSAGTNDCNDYEQQEQQELDGNCLTHPRCRKIQRKIDYDSYNYDYSDDEGKADDADDDADNAAAAGRIDIMRAKAEALAPFIEERLRELCLTYDALSASDRLVLQSISEDLDADDTSDEEPDEDEEGIDDEDDDDDEEEDMSV